MRMDNSSVITVLSRDELLAFMLPIFPLSAIGLVVNGIIVYLYVRYKALRAEGGFHMMALLAFFDLLNSAVTLQVDMCDCVSYQSNAKQVSTYRVYELYASPVTSIFFCFIVGGVWENGVTIMAAQLINIALCFDRYLKTAKGQ